MAVIADSGGIYALPGSIPVNLFPLTRVTTLFVALVVSAVPPVSVISRYGQSIDGNFGESSGCRFVYTTLNFSSIPVKSKSEEPEIRVKVKEFYEAAFEPGEIDTARRNVLRIEVPGGKPARFRLLRVRFLD